jgi:hypothetical protein
MRMGCVACCGQTHTRAANSLHDCCAGVQARCATRVRTMHWGRAGSHMLV